MKEVQADGRTISSYLVVPKQGSGPGCWSCMVGA